jgi:phosphoadenosine phosphosulfate reductase
MSALEPSLEASEPVADDTPVRAPAHAVPDLGELAEQSTRLETAPATSAIAWAWDRFGPDVVLAASFQDCVLIDLAMQVAPEIEVVFLDTQYHFAETLWFVDQVRDRYDLNLNVVSPGVNPDNLWVQDPDSCCNARKVEPLRRALEGKAAWITGLRRSESPGRAKAPIVSYDIGRGLVKVNPIAPWTDVDVDQYTADRELLRHPLHDRGYASIGCWPCTRPVADGEDPRAGRWAGTDKLECGLHS